MLSRNLEQTLHRALVPGQRPAARIRHAGASAARPRRRHRCRHRAARLRRRSRQAAQRSGRVPRQGPRRPRHRPGRRSEADRRLPARRAARRDPCAVLRPRRGDRRQRAGGAVLRAGEPCGLFPAAAGHDPARRGEFHQPRHRQGAGPVRAAAGAGHQPERGASRAGARGKTRTGATRTRCRTTASTSTRRRWPARSTR